MIDITQFDWWAHDFDDPEPHRISVFEGERDRVSELLGPDGEPLRIVRARPRIGFDLRPLVARGGA